MYFCLVGKYMNSDFFISSFQFNFLPNLTIYLTILDSEILVKVVKYDIQSNYEANLSFLAVLNGAFCNQDRVGDNTLSLRIQNLEWNMDFGTRTSLESRAYVRDFMNPFQFLSRISFLGNKILMKL